RRRGLGAARLGGEIRALLLGAGRAAGFHREQGRDLARICRHPRRNRRRPGGRAMIHTHNGVEIEVPPHIEKRMRRGDWKLLLALAAFLVLAILSATGIDDMLIAAGVTNGFVAFIVPVGKLAALASLTAFFIVGLNRRHRREQALLNFYLRAG